MVDQNLIGGSMELLQLSEETPSREAKSDTKVATERIGAKGLMSKKAFTATDKEARRRQKALEKPFSKAQKQAEKDKPLRTSQQESPFSALCSLSCFLRLSRQGSKIGH